MNLETKIQNSIRLALSKAGITSWRNETGKFWSGKVIHKENSSITLTNAAMIPVGLCVGSSDLICITPKTITQDMVGEKIGVFTAIEVKTYRKGSEASDDQTKFINHVKKMGGIAGIARSEEEALELLAR